MLEIKDVSIRLKNSDEYLIKKMTLYVRNGRLVPKTKLTNLERQTLFDYANHRCNYEVKIGKILYNGEDIKGIVDTSKKDRLLSTVRQIQEKRNDSISNFVFERAFSDGKKINKQNSFIVNYEDDKFDVNDLRFVSRPLTDNGFTLIELIATISILAILALIAVPNVVGVSEKSKNKTYLEDAKRMISLAEYKVNASSGNKPSSGGAKCFYISDLGKNEFSTEDGKAPNGGKYDTQKSYVLVENQYNSNGGYYEMKYSVQLIENKDYKNYFGIYETSKENLYRNSLSKLVKKGKSNFGTCCVDTSGIAGNDNPGGNTGGSDNRPGYNESTVIALDVKQMNFTSCGAIENWFLKNNQCKNSSAKDSVVFQVRGIGSNLNYSSNGNLKIPVNFVDKNVVNGQITATCKKADGYFSVEVPLDCSNETFKHSTGALLFEFPGNLITSSDNTLHNAATLISAGSKDSVYYDQN